LTDLSLDALFGILALLVILSAFFSGSETALMRLNRYRLLHHIKNNKLGAELAYKLLQRPDRLIGLILLGNNFINIFASSIATIIALRLYGEAGIAIAAGLLTFIILIFSEVAPKTWAALHPEKLAFPAALIYTPLLKVLYPIVWVVNSLSSILLKLFGIDINEQKTDAMETDELRTVVTEAGALIPRQHKDMLLGILDLEHSTVEDIMIPANETAGIDLSDDIEEIKKQLPNSSYSNLPVFDENIEKIQGVIRIKNTSAALTNNELTITTIQELASEPYFIPNNTSLYTQLINFQKNKRRFAVVVNEYGVILGIITLQDVLEEVIGEFTTDPSDSSPDIQQKEDGSLLISANITIRELNRSLNWTLPTSGPKTLNGLIMEYLEAIPEPGTSLKLYDHPIEIIQMESNAIKLIKIKN